MQVSLYNFKDVKQITNLGNKLHNNYKFNLDVYSTCLVLKENDYLIGFIIYSVIYDRAEIIDIIIDEKYRGMGYGSLLLEKAIDHIIQKRCNNITLEVNSSNKFAIKLYKTNNFKIVGVRKKYYNNDDAYLMERKLG